MRSEVITLCGSTRFQDEFNRLNKELTLAGFAVFSCGVFGKGRDADVFDGVGVVREAALKRILDSVHADKIAMSDAIYVVNPGGYIGESTWREIAFAAMSGKGIYSMEEIGEDSIFERMNDEAKTAERLASWQLDAVAHNALGPSEVAASFPHQGVEVLDPWIRETQQGEPFAWEMHGDPGFKIDPAEHYGRKKFARFVFDAMLSLDEYRRVEGKDLIRPGRY